MKGHFFGFCKSSTVSFYMTAVPAELCFVLWISFYIADILCWYFLKSRGTSGKIALKKYIREGNLENKVKLLLLWYSNSLFPGNKKSQWFTPPLFTKSVHLNFVCMQQCLLYQSACRQPYTPGSWHWLIYDLFIYDNNSVFNMHVHVQQAYKNWPSAFPKILVCKNRPSSAWIWYDDNVCFFYTCAHCLNIALSVLQPMPYKIT